ncbi:hypothetical protein [Rhizobium sp. C4]|uniref:hypothetical protein n=1 Tax=Rhizobium sp. C4 TaxID=1349800 RepID=UPI001E3A4987|nr:hypothetical protein [Rhizobium sp. C4]MCD2172658.1 hypothetical protein [Rhizobium sp. C4]
MNKIVREHYPVENLPADLREGLEGIDSVRIVLETPIEEIATSGLSALKSALPPPRKPMSLEESLEAIRSFRAKNVSPVSLDEAVASIRELRDEWDY